MKQNNTSNAVHSSNGVHSQMCAFPWCDFSASQMHNHNAAKSNLDTEHPGDSS